MNIAQALEHATSKLDVAGIDSPRLEAEIILARVLQCDRSFFISHSDAMLIESNREDFW